MFKFDQLIKYEKPLSGIFNGEIQARRIYQALCGLRTDNATIIDVLASCNNFRRSRILKHYKTLFGRKLTKDIQNELGGCFEVACGQILMEPKDLLVKLIQDALTEFPYPNEDFLISLLCERSNEEVQIIRKAYRTKHKTEIEKSFDKYLSPEGSRYLKILIHEHRQEEYVINYSEAITDAQALVNLGIGVRFNGSGPVIVSLLRKRSYPHLRLVFSEFNRITKGGQVWNRLEKQMNIKHRERLRNLTRAISNPQLYVTKCLRASKDIKFGEFLLIIRLTRSREFFKAVELIYTQIYNVKMTDEIIGQIGGDFSTLLIRILQS